MIPDGGRGFIFPGRGSFRVDQRPADDPRVHKSRVVAFVKVYDETRPHTWRKRQLRYESAEYKK